ncbi:conserved Plasmodium protein, unknown function [Plasmodium malariae]|uniref:Uncharacterized protein n=1 Tax=Plasmodium malariae TaxID=5858 RepID=A0A1A8VL92_PLAMA|nr:conserved Plasmodium protein, unknown function [Plasmodium malariae]
MNITIKESLEHVCDVLNYFGIEYITAELLRRGKSDKSVKRKNVIIRYCFLINDLCLLYCFEYKRKFKATYNQYMNKEILKAEETFIKNGKKGKIKVMPRHNKNRDIKWNYGSKEWDYNDDGVSCNDDGVSCNDDGDSCNDDGEGDNDDNDDEVYPFEELGEDVNYFDDFYIISPLVILVLEYFEYPRLYQLMKCNFQMTKELLLCIGFLIDSTKMFEHYDKRQLYYEKFFQNLCNSNDNANSNSRSGPSSGRKNVSTSSEKRADEKNIDEQGEYKFYHFINEAMLLLSNRPYDLEIFEYKYLYNFLQKLKKCTNGKDAENGEKGAIGAVGEGRKRYDINKGNYSEQSVNNYLSKKKKIKNKDTQREGKYNTNNDYTNCSERERNVKREYDEETRRREGKEEGERHEQEHQQHGYGNGSVTKKDDKILSLSEYAAYDYSTYQESFLDYYNSNANYDEENQVFYLDEDNNHIFINEITRNINKNCNKLIQLQNKMSVNINQLEHLDKNRLLLFQKFNQLINAYSEPHSVVVNLNDIYDLSGSKQTSFIFDKVLIDKQKKIDLMNNVLFTVTIDAEKGKEDLQNKPPSSNNLFREDCKKKTCMNSNMNINSNSSYGAGSLPQAEDHFHMPQEFMDNINYDLLSDKITINEFLILNDVPLYNKIVHIYKYGIHFFHYEQLRAVFWLWLQSIFPDNVSTDDSVKDMDLQNAPIDFNDIINNQFFVNTVAPTSGESRLEISVLSDLNHFEKNYRVLKEYLNDKGCTSGYNKISRSEKKDESTSNLNNATLYINNLHNEFEAFYNYKKKSKNLYDEMFVEFLEEKKKNMTIQSNVEKEDYTNLANIVNKHLVGVDKILKYYPILNFSKIVEGIKHQNFIRTVIDVNQIETNDWHRMYTYHKGEKRNVCNSGNSGNTGNSGNSGNTGNTGNSGNSGNTGNCSNNGNTGNNSNGYTKSGSSRCTENYIINLTSSSSYRMQEKPITYASTIFNYSDQFISNNDIYTFSDNIHKECMNYSEFLKGKQNKCAHNFYHALRKIEKYMNCITYNI